MGKTILRSPAFTIALFVLAAVLLVGGTVGAVQAAPSTQSNDYGAQVQLSSVHTAVVENGSPAGDKLLGGLVKDGESFVIGKEYDETLAVQNTGSTPEYVRATVLRYWTDENGKAVDLDPSLIKLSVVDGSGWSIDNEASTPERTVLYYSGLLQPGDTTSPFVEKLSIDTKVMYEVTRVAELAEYDYEGVQFHVEVTADAVQDHNGNAAMTSAWGRTI